MTNVQKTSNSTNTQKDDRNADQAGGNKGASNQNTGANADANKSGDAESIGRREREEEEQRPRATNDRM